MTIGERIQYAREQKKISLSELGRRLQTSASTVQRWEKGDVSPTWGTLERIARGLDMSTEELVTVHLADHGTMSHPITGSLRKEMELDPEAAAYLLEVIQSGVLKIPEFRDALRSLAVLARLPRERQDR